MRPRPGVLTLSRVALALGIFVVFSIGDPRYASEGNIFAMTEGFVIVGLAALGVAITIIAGEFDLSIPSVALVAGVIAAQVSSLGLVPAMLIAVAAATLFGFVQGTVIAWLRINSIVFTVGSFIALRGVAHILTDSSTAVIADFSMATTLSQRMVIFSPASVIALTVFVLVGLFLAYTRYGREIYAIGGGRTEAIAAGIPLSRPIIVAFTLSAMLAGLTGALVTLKTGSVNPAIGFNDLLLPSVTAALIGGVSLLGGRGTALGIFIGILTIRFIASGLSLQGAPFHVTSLAIGAVLLAVIVFDLATESDRVIARWRAWRTTPAS